MVLTGAVVEENAQVGAGAVVPQGKVVPAGWLVMGVPAKPVRKMAAEELRTSGATRRRYVDLWHRDYGPRPAPPSRGRARARRTGSHDTRRTHAAPHSLSLLRRHGRRPSREALFHEVYDKEHIPALLEVPGVVSAARFKLRDSR